MRTLTQPLNMSPGGIPPVIHVSQYDSDFTIVFNLFSTVGDFTIESGTTAVVRGTKSSGTGYSAGATINISAKTVTVAGNAQMTAAAGQNVFEITLLKGGKEISSKNFILLCERAALDADTITDESVLKELNAIIESADTATQAAEEAEDAADRAEAAAQTLVIDPVPTQGSSNAVSSGGVYEEIDGVKNNLNTLIGDEEPREITGWVYGKYINVANANIGDTVDITNVSSFYSLKYVIVNCEEGDKFLLNLAGAGSARAWAFLTSSNVLISRADASVTLTDATIIAPQNAGKAIFQCIYRQSPDDTTTDNGTAYKIVGGSGNVVRFDIAQDKTEEEKARARENLGISSGEGLSDEAKNALLACFEHVAWIDEHGQDYYDALEEALYGITPSDKIAVVFDSRGRTFYTDDPISTIRPHLTVTYDGATTTTYDLVGTLSGGNIRVKIGEEYSRVIPLTAESPKYEYSTANGSAELSIIDAGIDFSATPAPGLNWNVTTSTAIATRSGRKPYTNGNGWHMIPVPADCTSVTVSVQPATVKYGMILYKFVPSSNTNNYISQVTEQTGTNTFSIAAQDLRTIALTANNYGTRATGCSVTFS